MMHGREKSDSAIVAGKPTNKAVPTAAEPVEPRAGAKGNASQQSTHRTQGRERVSYGFRLIDSMMKGDSRRGAKQLAWRAMSREADHGNSWRAFES
jgi:hypothetical protein